jgi:hypothetical protein
MDSHATGPETPECPWREDPEGLRLARTRVEELNKAVGGVNPRPPGWHNDLIQLVKKLLARLLAWYIRPLQHLAMAIREEAVCASENQSINMGALEVRLAQEEKRRAAETKSTQEQLQLLHEQMQALISLQNTANLEVAGGGPKTDRDKLARDNSRFYRDTGLGNDRTAYVLGLFGTGRLYINEVIRENIGKRAKYFRDEIRLHPGPTSMIYSGHITMKHVSRGQISPTIMGQILEAVKSRFADSIFVYRHPLDSLLTNWVWWRTYLHDNRVTSGIAHAYANRDDLCTDLEQNFPEFERFAQGDFFASMPGPRFLSFPEFIEEIELHRKAATLVLRLEDVMRDPLKEFSKIVEVMSVDIDLSSLNVPAPMTKAYGYVTIREKIPLFRNFIEGLDIEIKRRIEELGYDVGV